MGMMMGLDESTRDLVDRLRGGDSRTGEALVARYRDELVQYIQLRVGRHLRGVIEVDDVFQETFATALASVTDFRWQGEGSFGRWLRRIAENRILALAKRHRRDEVLFVSMEDRPHAGPSPSVASERDERFERLESALNGLAPDYREVIVLARLRGLRLTERDRAK